MVAPFSRFYGKIWVGFSLNTGKCIYFKINRKSIGSSKKCIRNYFQNSYPLEKSACFYVAIAENFECFQCFNFKLSRQNPMLRQVEWGVQNGPITKNGFLPNNYFIFWKFCFSLSTSFKGLIWCCVDLILLALEFCLSMFFPIEYY